MYIQYILLAMTIQLSLLGHERPAFDAGFEAVARRALADGAWIDHGQGWLRGHTQVLETLLAGTRWRAESRPMYERVVEVPRLTARLPDDGAGHPVIDAIGRSLSARYGVGLESVSLSYYRDGRDSVALHGDRVGRGCRDTVVGIVSVGEPRRFLLKPVAGGDSLRLSLGLGDLLVMGGSCQRTWLHGVPKAARAGPRISIQYRASRARPDGRGRCAWAPRERGQLPAGGGGGGGGGGAAWK
jgi:alkylated DNA repair dioxygenase AlkB